MPIDSVENLLAVLHRLQVLQANEVQEIKSELCPHFTDPHELANYLVEIQWLTEYQVHLLFGGRWEELQIGPYLILDRLGEGGVSEVFKAWDPVHGRLVALKVLHQHLTDQTCAIREFQRELQAVTRLSHPNIIQTFDAHQLGSSHYFAMEYIEGMDLDRYVRRSGPLPIEQACDYIRQVAQGLQHAHQVGLVHRDIKPANLFLVNPPPLGAKGPSRPSPDTVVKILDWGLARIRPDAGGDVDPSGMDRDAEKGMLIGTADYIAPEQARDPCLVDIRADVYSLGCTLYFLLTGQPPFPGISLMQKLMRHQEADRPLVRDQRADVPEELAAVVQRMMARRAEHRYAIPLLIVGALLPFVAAGTPRPGSWPNAVSSKPATALELTPQPSASRGR